MIIDPFDLIKWGVKAKKNANAVLEKDRKLIHD